MNLFTEKDEGKQKYEVPPSTVIQYSDIWNQSKRHHISQSKQSDNDLNKMKESLLYVDSDGGNAKQPIPSITFVIYYLGDCSRSNVLAQYIYIKSVRLCYSGYITLTQNRNSF